MSKSRRNFLKNAGFVSVGFIGLNRFISDGSLVESFLEEAAHLRFGPLVYRPDDILALPEGFSHRIISRHGDIMSDGLISPGMHDGMGAFSLKNDKVLLIRNHEILPGPQNTGPFGVQNEHINKIPNNKIYDFAKGKRTCLGGTTSFIYNERTGRVELEYLSLVGTIRNCAGGVTPWNSWITCEETEMRTGSLEGFIEKDHGYNFEVPATERIGLIDPMPIKPMGRFVHEAVAVHPQAGIVYQTEDSDTGIFYRYLPDTKGQLHKGGKLQCLALKEWKSADTRNWATLKTDRFPTKKFFDTEWIDMDNVESPDGDLRLRGFQKGAVRFSRGEGIWYGKNELFFACTSGGTKGLGQIFRYVPSKYEGQPKEKDLPGKLELFLEPNDTAIFQNCDNLTVAPWGDVIICEDKADPRVIGITPKGKTYVIAKNIGYRLSEFAGPVFSPSGNTLFVNIQSPGLTLAITGPWKKL
ncbi:MAG: DUF839 domain-containing protein [Chitinophagaceae bacterium]|nr:DUF839 domain-containing protein [Chitinophagaceae bacterium]